VRHRPAALRGQSLPASAVQMQAVLRTAQVRLQVRLLQQSARAGTLPPEYGQLVKLTHLSASDNGLSGAHESHGWPYAHCLCFLVCLLVKDAQDACNASASVYAGPIPPMPKLESFYIGTHPLNLALYLVAFARVRCGRAAHAAAV